MATPNTVTKTRSRTLRTNSDARDAVLRAAEDAKQDGLRSIQAQQAVKMVDAADLKDLVEDMPDEFVQCRAFGHGRALANYINKRGIISFTLYCPTCKFARHIVMDRQGSILEDKPDWPEGYLLPKGSGRIGAGTKGVVRIASLQRTLGQGKTKRSRSK